MLHEDLIAIGFDVNRFPFLVEATDYAEKRGLDPDVVRRACRSKTDALICLKVFGRVVVDPDDPANQMWEPSETVARTRREDGRNKFIIYLLDPKEVELIRSTLAAQGMPEDCLVPANKKRSAKVKTASEDLGDSDDEDDEDDPFTTFGA